MHHHAVGTIMETRYNATFIILSVVVAVIASFVALEFSIIVSKAKIRMRALWLTCGALAMGIGIWSMHFVGMLAFEMPGMAMAYDIPLMLLSIVIAVGASWLALFIVSRPEVSMRSLLAGGCAMAAAISGMHYTGMYSMRMAAVIEWNYLLVAASVLVALVASYSALFIALRIRNQPELYWLKLAASVLMGFAISGMHYTGMIAATFRHSDGLSIKEADLLATDGLAIAVLVGTVLILGLALASSAVEQALSRRVREAEESSRLYGEANKALSDLKVERELRERFMSALAHDLRTPLAAAKMSAQLGMRKSTDRDAVEKHCGKTLDNLQRMDSMIQDLLDAHRVTAGQKLSLKTEPLELREFLHSALEILITVYGQRFRLECAEGIQVVWDKEAMRRVLENLCTNAVKYGQPNSSVTITARPSGTDRLQLSVHNFGRTIPVEEQQQLFGLFQRGKGHDEAGRVGWGLGLTIVKGIAEAHGGEVRAQSGPESGTTFLVELPLRAGTAGLIA